MRRHLSPALRRRAAVAALAAGVVAAVGLGYALDDGPDGAGPDRPTSADRRPTEPVRPSGPATAPGTRPPTADPSPSAPATAATPSGRAPGARRVETPKAGAAFDYQIGGPYDPPPGTAAVSRDHTVDPAAGLYNVCYVNAFQAQPDATDWWQRNHPDLLLHDPGGHLVIDEDWHEVLLDTSTADKRTRLAAVVGGWIDECASRGYQAVEPDNLDSYDRSDGRLDQDDNAAFAKLIADRAHADGLAIGQKNTTEMLDRRAAVGFDFAVAEECGRYDECGSYAAAYGDRVFVVEYRQADFDRACAAWGGRLSVVLRDRDVRPAGTSGHVFRRC